MDTLTSSLRTDAEQASAQQDWDAAIRLWSVLHEQNPEDAEAALQLVEALGACDRSDEAERVLRPVATRSEAAAVQYAWLAQHRKDWATALQRWEVVRSFTSGSSVGYTAAAGAMWQLERVDEAERLLAAAMAINPDDSTAVHFAWSASIRRDWDQAVLRWRAVLSFSPKDVTAWLCLGAALVALRRFEEWERDVLPVAKRHPESLELREQRAQVRGSSREEIDDDDAGMDFLCTQFQSLGETCEFALVQRHFGAEPVSLLRWASIGIADLERALDHGFAGLGESAAFQSGRREYILRDATYAAEFHSFVAVDAMAAAAFGERMRQRLRRLADALLDDLRSAEKVFVCKLRRDDLAGIDLAPLLAAMRRIGPARLLCVVVDPVRHESTLFEELAPGLAVGYLGAVGGGDYSPAISYWSWKCLLREAARRWDLPLPPAAAAVPPDTSAPENRPRSFLRLAVRNRWSEETGCILTAPAFTPGDNLISGAAYRWDGSLILPSLRPAGLGDVRPIDPVSIAPADYAAAPETADTLIYGGHFFGMWGHFLLETLASAASADEMPHCPVIFVPFGASARDPALLKDWERCKPLLAAAGWGDRPLILQAGAMRVANLIVPERLSVYGALPGEPVMADEMSDIYRRVRTTIAGAARPLRPVVACRPMWTSRRHDAEERLYRMLEAQGCVLANGVDLSPVEQIEICATASVLIGFAGSNLHNSVFCHEGIPVLEIGDDRSYLMAAQSGAADLRNTTQVMLSALLRQPVIFIDSFHDSNDVAIPLTAAELADSIYRSLATLRPPGQIDPLQAFLLGGDRAGL